jgi:hypothetical protein
MMSDIEHVMLAVKALSLLGLSMISPWVSAQVPRLPDALPLAMTFKAETKVKHNDPEFTKRLAEAAPFVWLHAPGIGKKLALTREKYPNKFISLQDAYGGISEVDIAAVWPGHWLYKAGTLVTKDIAPTDNVLQVKDISRIVKNSRRINKGKQKNALALTLYALTSEHKPDWSRYEHVIVTAVEHDKVRVERGQWGTKPLAFSAQQTVVAGHMMFWSKQWQLNISADSPKGGVNQLTAAEWYAHKIAEKLIDAKVAGVEFDVGRWTWGYPEQNPMDINNDLIPDYGYLQGVNSFGLGGQLFFKTLRQLVGADKLIQVDSNDAIYGVRGWQYVNGIQQEAFPHSNDYDRFSQAFWHLRLWAENAQAEPKISYPFTKAPTTVYANAHLADGSKTDFRFRIGLAAASLLGMPHPFASLSSLKFDPANIRGNEQDEDNEQFGIFNWDEYHAGDLNTWQWLGKPVTAATQDLSDLGKQDLVQNISWMWQAGPGFSAETAGKSGVFTADVKQIPEGSLPELLWEGVTLRPKGELKPLQSGHEYTLEFAARGNDSWRYGGQDFLHVPRMLTINGAIKGLRAQPMAVLIDDHWRTYRLSFSVAAPYSLTPIFGVSEQIGNTQIRDIKLYEGGAERWARSFEKGLVLLNMTQHPWRYALAKKSYKRLKGKQAPEINSGENVDNDITVPVRDAVFLIAR